MVDEVIADTVGSSITLMAIAPALQVLNVTVAAEAV